MRDLPSCTISSGRARLPGGPVAEFKNQSMRAAKKRAKRDAAERAMRAAEAPCVRQRRLLLQLRLMTLATLTAGRAI